MAGESLFKDLEIQAFRAGITPRTKESIRWFQDKARQMFRGRFTMNRRKIMQDDALDLRNKPITRTGPQGNMYMWVLLKAGSWVLIYITYRQLYVLDYLILY